MTEAVPSPIDVSGGFYTAREAARLLGVANVQRIVRWLTPGPNGGEPIIFREYQRIGNQHELSFLDLIEIRFVEHFRRQNISLQALRVAARNARRELAVSHPFAMSSVKFQSDRRQVFLDTARETGDRVFLNLMTNQVEMYDVIEQLMAKDLQFDVSGFAREWTPQPGLAPNVTVNPLHAFGRPVISERHVPTRALFNTWQAENGDYDVAGDWHRVPVAAVREAVQFEVATAH